MDQKKQTFINSESMLLFKNLAAGAEGKWGKMNGQQMIEHLAAFFYVSAGKIKFELVTPVEHLPKYKEFLLSDKEFRENTRAPLTVIGEDALPLRYATMQEALTNLQQSIQAFEDCFKENPLKTTLHPVFGELNFEEWVLLHYKHVAHHARQFGLM